jgi:hypothetical protein
VALTGVTVLLLLLLLQVLLMATWLLLRQVHRC